MSELRFNLGGIIISLVSLDKTKKLAPYEVYKSFITSGKPDAVLRLNKELLPRLKAKTQIFDSGGTWSLFRQNGNYILKIFDRTVIFNQDFTCGDIYLNNASRNDYLACPLEYPLSEVLMINLLARDRGIIIHGCGVMHKGEGLLFIGSSGAGKSTIANLWKDEKDTAVLSDDRIIIRKIGSKFWMYGTPWHGDAKLASPERVFLKKIFFLKHYLENRVCKISPLDIVSRLIVCSFPPFWNKEGLDFTLGFCTELARDIPSYELGFVADKSVLDFIRTKT